MTRKASSISIFAIALLSGCAVAPPGPSGFQLAKQQLDVCVSRVRASPEFQPVIRAGHFVSTKPTLDQITDTRFATNEEIEAIHLTHPRMEDCRAAFVNDVSRNAPTIAPIFTTEFAKNEDSLVDLLQKRQSWGEYFRRSREVAAEAQAQLGAEVQSLVATDKVERAQRQERVSTIMQQNQQLQLQQQPQPPLFYAMPPIATNRPGFNCTTNRVGGTAYTNCW
jgi:hypothetical protein